jgi:predicted ester cyclase
MSPEDNKALVRRYRQAHNSNNLAALDDIVAADIISHNVLPGLPSGLEGGKMAHMGFAAAFPDGQVTTEDLIAEGDKVVERFSFHGTNTGSFMGAPPTNKKVTSSGISIFRIANGKIVEHWGENDALGTLQQLGFVPTPGQAG